MDRNLGITAIFVVAAIVIAGAFGFYSATITTAGGGSTITATTTATSTVTSNSTEPYDITLVITTNNIYNSTVGDQPAYYVLGANGLESTANISLPAHRLIRLVIVCYDDGPANLTGSQYATVTGTFNNEVYDVNNENVNSTQVVTGIQIAGGQNVSSVSPDNIAHTFTVPQIGLNIPIMPSSTVTAYFTLNQTGTFSWFCETQCGSGPDGTEGAMSTTGWMTGSITAS